MANPEHVKVVKGGQEAIARWRQEHPGVRLNLSGAHLSGAHLSGAHLSGADLSRAHLFGTYLSWADLAGANLTKVMCAYTCFAACDLSQCLGLESVEHWNPSTVGVDTLAVSFRGAGDKLTPELTSFFLGAGVPKELLDALPGILAEVKYCSSFICYGEPDKAFAEKLRDDLKARGVSSWIYSMDYTPGEHTWREIGQRRREMEKMVVLCSAQALVRDGVKKEIEEQIDEEPDKMVPVSLDNLWREDGFLVMRGKRDLKPFLKDRNYADFSAPSLYQQSLEKLLKGLKRQSQPPAEKA